MVRRAEAGGRVSETRDLGALRLHPQADAVPVMHPDEHDSLLADVEARGILTPLDILGDGTILDGRHRWQVASTLGLRMVPVRVVDPTDPYVYMLKAAMERRHLTKGQRAMLALRLDEYQQARVDARERQGERTDLQSRSGNIAQKSDPAPRPRDVAASEARVSPRLVQDAKAVAERAPELAARVVAGTMTVSAAARQVRRAEDRARAAAAPPVTEHVAGQRYRCIVIDPPWDPSDEGDADQMGRAQPT